MSNNEVLVAVIQIVGFAVVDCSSPHVQIVSLTMTSDFLQSGNSDNIDHFIHGHGIIDIGLLTDASGNLQGNCCTQIAGMVVHRPVLQNIQHYIVDLVGSALQRRKKTSAGHNACEFTETVSVSLDSRFDGLKSEIELGVNGTIRFYDIDIVFNVILPKLVGILVQGNLCGCRAGIDHKNLHAAPPFATSDAKTIE